MMSLLPGVNAPREERRLSGRAAVSVAIAGLFTVLLLTPIATPIIIDPLPGGTGFGAYLAGVNGLDSDFVSFIPQGFHFTHLNEIPGGIGGKWDVWSVRIGCLVYYFHRYV
jgi:hypothetical protein